MDNPHSKKNKGSPNILLSFLKKKPKPNNESESPELQAVTCSKEMPTAEITQKTFTNEPYDIANFVNEYFDSDETKIGSLHQIWIPNETFAFPLDQNTTHKRKFNYLWLKRFSWLAYSQKLDGAFCKYCVFFASQFAGQSSSQSLGNLCRDPFRTWKRAIEKFEHHQSTNYHKFSVLRADNLEQNLKRQTSINQILDSASLEMIQKNRQKLTPIIKTVIFCGRTGLPLRGHRDSGALELRDTPLENLNKNEGNFRNLLKFRLDAGDEILKEHIKSSAANATYISWDIQNQIVEACNNIILKKIVDEINQAKAFVVLADETADISNKEQLTLCVRYVKDNKICENFLQFVQITSTTGVALATSILQSLEDWGINLKYICGQGYDGAAAMSGHIKGVQKIISDKFPAAKYVHCASHNLNLCLSSSSEVTEIRNCLGTIEKCYAFFNTPKREHVLLQKIEVSIPESKRHGLKQLCPTRWVERHDSVIVMEELYKPLCLALEEIEVWTDRSTSSEASTLLNSLRTPKFLISLLSIKTIYAFTLPLSKLLQTKNLDLSHAIDLADHVINQLKVKRCNADEEFSTIFTEAETVLEEYEIEIKMPRLPARQTQRLVVSANSAEEYFRASVFIPFLDCLISHLNERFLNHRNIVSLFKVLFPSPLNLEENINGFFELHEFYANNGFFETFSNKTILKGEFILWNEKFANDSSHLDAFQLYSECDATIFPNIKRLLQIFITLPVTTSTPERSFSNLKYLKSYLRSTTSQDRLNGLALLFICDHIQVSPDEVLNELAKKKRRLNIIL